MGCGMSDDQAGLSRMDRWRRTGGLKTDPIEGELRVRRVEVRREEFGRTCARTPSRDEMPTFVELTVKARQLPASFSLQLVTSAHYPTSCRSCSLAWTVSTYHAPAFMPLEFEISIVSYVMHDEDANQSEISS
ncbi:hypothetical protein CROQUDRAFT_85583 [Cronartium quercuum f. sp. fusiforme G11]|uniref:Uncharacterized protein n=1 Tax=Cronartium quercuum f. sp. fusiforme G11 TaxID=708437 RepID=A0A9P6THG5_9BASI|nr:hypothetical protein CROQUDRAFT_85583 [Cronartium quercuum f. sp. fusiforme G11]